MKNFYEILGVPIDADSETLKKAYYQVSRKYHPDNYVSEPEEIQRENESRMKEATEAYSILSNEQKRQEYDKKFRMNNTFSNQSFTSQKTQSFMNNQYSFFHPNPDIHFDSFLENDFSSTNYDLKKELLKQKKDINQKIANRKREIYSFWRAKENELYEDCCKSLPSYYQCQDLESRIQLVENKLIYLREKLSYQVMPFIYQQKEQELITYYNELKRLNEEYQTKMEEYRKQMELCKKNCDNQILNDSKLLSLMKELDDVETEIVNLESVRKRKWS